MEEKLGLRGQGQKRKEYLKLSLSFSLTADCITSEKKHGPPCDYRLGLLGANICSGRGLVLRNIPANALVLAALRNDTITMSYAAY